MSIETSREDHLTGRFRTGLCQPLDTRRLPRNSCFDGDHKHVLRSRRNTEIRRFDAADWFLFAAAVQGPGVTGIGDEPNMRPLFLQSRQPAIKRVIYDRPDNFLRGIVPGSDVGRQERLIQAVPFLAIQVSARLLRPVAGEEQHDGIDVTQVGGAFDTVTRLVFWVT